MILCDFSTWDVDEFIETQLKFRVSAGVRSASACSSMRSLVQSPLAVESRLRGIRVARAPSRYPGSGASTAPIDLRYCASAATFNLGRRKNAHVRAFKIRVLPRVNLRCRRINVTTGSATTPRGRTTTVAAALGRATAPAARSAHPQDHPVRCGNPQSWFAACATTILPSRRDPGSLSLTTRRVQECAQRHRRQKSQQERHNAHHQQDDTDNRQAHKNLLNLPTALTCGVAERVIPPEGGGHDAG